MKPGRPALHPHSLWLFAVEPDRVQLTWRDLGPGPIVVHCGDARVAVETTGGPGSVVLTGLVPDRRHELRVEGPDAGLPPGGIRRSFDTPPHPPGEELSRFATVSDLHLGEYRFGYFGTMQDLPGHEEVYPVRALRSALTALSTWGAELLAVKGDVTAGACLPQWELFRDLTGELDVPVAVVPGNHDNRPAELRTRTSRQQLLWTLRGGPIRRWLGPGHAAAPLDTREALDRIGHPFEGHHRTVDLPGVRVVLADTTIEDRHLGSFDHLVEPVTNAAAEARLDGRSVWIGGHHPPMRHEVPTFWPPGVPRAESIRFLRGVAAANPRAFYTAGHTHRNRRYVRAGVTCTEVGSPKDYPGTWSGYVVHEGGIRQVTYRVVGADVLPWLDRSAGAALGLWGAWSPGRRSDRCFSLAWDR